MAISYSGLYQYPLGDGVPFIFMLFETTHSSAESNYVGLINTEFRDFQLSSVQGSVLVCWHERTHFYCSDTFYSTETQLYTLPRSANPQIDGYCINTINSTSGANVIFPAGGTAYYSSFYVIAFIKTSDNHYCRVLMSCIALNAETGLLIGLNPPTQSFPGFVVCDFRPGTITTSQWNSDANTSRLSNYLSNNPPKPWVEHTDPYTPGGNTEPGGGEGTGPEGIINDDIDFPTPLTISAANANFISIWTPTLDQVQTLAKWMWTTDPLKWEFWQKLLQNPLDLIFSLTIMPVPIFHPNDSGSPAEDELIANTDSLSLGWQNTGILMDWVPEQYVTIDMGTINLEEVWGAFLDYEPYTKIDIFLPYIGTKQLDTNDCMPRSISLRYVIDLATGTCVALIKCDNSVYYHFSGNCASQIPITVNQCQEIVRGLMTMAVGAATFALGGPMGAGAHASKAAIAKGAAMKAGGAAMVGSGADSAAKGVNVSRSGVIGAAAGLMDVQTPYLIISRPRQAVPEDQNKYTGYPSFITEQIGDLSGYTEVQMIHLHNMSCTDEEYKEIDSLLMQGVII